MSTTTCSVPQSVSSRQLSDAAATADNDGDETRITEEAVANLNSEDWQREADEYFRAGAENVRLSVRGYLGRGYKVVPIPLKEKGAVLEGWNKLRITDADIDEYFPPDRPQNVGLLVGEPIGGLVDVDLDCPEAVDL